jgi:colicin import membrane protein
MAFAEYYDRFEERYEPGIGRAVGYAVLVHLVLLGILFVGVRWHSHRPAPMTVELYRAPPAAEPRAAVQPPKPLPPKPEPPKPVPKVEPPPPKPAPKPEPKIEAKPEPRIEKPDIVEKAVPKPEPKPEAKPEPKPQPKAEVKPKPKPQPKPQPKAEAKPKPQPKPAPPRDAAAQRQLRQELAREEAAIRAERQDAELRALLEREASTRALAAWTDKIRAKIRGNIILPPSMSGNPEAIFDVVLLPTGDVLGTPHLRRSSGDPRYDDAVLRAILKSSPLPRPDDPKVFQRNLELRFRPQE